MPARLATSAEASRDQIGIIEADPFMRPESLAPKSWWVLGPFPLELSAQGARQGLEKDFVVALGGEANATIGAGTTLEWQGQRMLARQVHADASSIVNLLAAFPGTMDERLAYAYGVVDSPRAQVVHARFGSDDAAQVWLNGVCVYRVTVDRGIDPDAYSFEMKLEAGENRLLVKVDNGRGDWGFALRLFDQRGLDQLEVWQRRQDVDPLMPAPPDGSYLLGDKFPELRSQHRASMLVFGDAQPRVRWFGPDFTQVTQPGPPGRYVAVVEMRSLDADVHRRSLGFSKGPPLNLGALAMAQPEDPDFPVSVPQGLGFSQAQRRELALQIWAGGVRSLFLGPEAAQTRARLMELAQETQSEEASAWLASGMVRDAEHQLLQRMTLERRTARPLAQPTPASAGAASLRVGSEREADVPSGSAAQIRRLAQAWARADPYGFVVVVARKGVVFFHEGFNGFSPETKFRPTSLGKTIGALLFARAVDQGLLDFDQRVGDVLPDWAEGAQSEVTFRNLFNHVAGLRSHSSHDGLGNTYLDNALALMDARFSEPRKRFFYSGDGGNLAAKALELTTGTSIFRLLYDHVQEPFDASVQQYDMGIGEAFSAAYLARLGQMVLQDGAYGGKRFYSPGFLKKLWPKPISESVPDFEGKEEWGIGFEWMVDPDGPRSKGVLGPNVIGHHSATGCVFRIVHDQNLVIVVGRSGYTGAWGDNEGRIDRFVVGLAKALGLAATQ